MVFLLLLLLMINDLINSIDDKVDASNIVTFVCLFCFLPLEYSIRSIYHHFLDIYFYSIILNNRNSNK